MLAAELDSPEITRVTATTGWPRTPTWKSSPRWSWARPNSSGGRSCRVHAAIVREGRRAAHWWRSAPCPGSWCATALPRSGRGGRKVLVAIFQRGAVDGLNMVVPHGDPDYYGARGRSRSRGRARRRRAAVDLDGFFGLHPSLAPLKPLWDDRQPRGRPRVRLARHHALALRRAGLHGVGHAGRQEHARRLAGPRPAASARASRPRPSAPSRSAPRCPASCAATRARSR